MSSVHKEHIKVKKTRPEESQNRLQNSLLFMHVVLLRAHVDGEEQKFASLPFRFHMIMGMLLDASEFVFPLINFNVRLRMSNTGC